MIDNENPEWTRKDFQRAVPLKEAAPELYAAWKNKGGRPRKENPKIRTGIRLDADVLMALKSRGKGWQTLANGILRDWMEQRPV